MPLRALLVALPLLAIGCSEPPLEEIAAAEAAMQDARDANAPTLASEAYAAAEEAMTETYRLNDAKEYDQARDKAIETRRLAERARDLALQAKRSKGEVDETDEGDGGRLDLKNEAETRAEIESSEIGAGSMEEGARIADLEPVYFDFDDYAIRDDQMDKVHTAADWLKGHPSAEVVLEGHTDERGSADYNMVLGQRRAESVQDLLVSLGVEAERIEVQSFGEELPAATGHDESAWARNRRVEFVLKTDS